MTPKPKWRHFRDWEKFTGQRFANLKTIRHPTLVVNGIYDEMIPVQNSYWLSVSLPNAVLMTYPTQATAHYFNFTSFSRGKRRHSWLPMSNSRLTDPGRSAAFDSLVDRADIRRFSESS